MFYPFRHVIQGHSSPVFEVSHPFGARVTQGGIKVVISDSLKGALIFYKKGKFETISRVDYS